MFMFMDCVRMGLRLAACTTAPSIRSRWLGTCAHDSAASSSLAASQKGEGMSTSAAIAFAVDPHQETETPLPFSLSLSRPLFWCVGNVVGSVANHEALQFGFQP